MGQFKENEPRHPNAGRKAGVPNKSTEELRKAFAQLLNGRIEALNKDLDELSPKDRIYAVCEIAKHVLPKQKQVEAELGYREIIIRDETTYGLP